MLVDPKRVVFETKEDIVDYVTKGFFPPMESNFNEVMNKVRNPDNASDPNLVCKRGKEVIIDNSVVSDEDRQILDEVLTKVYENRVRNRNITLATIIGGIMVAGIFSLFSSDDKCRKETYIDEFGNTITKF